MGSKKLPQYQLEAIIEIVVRHANRMPTKYMVAYWLRKKTGISLKTAKDYVRYALRDGHVELKGITVCKKE